MQVIRQAIKRKSSDRQAFGNNNISRNKNCVNIFCIVGQNLKAFKEKVGEDVKVFPISAIIHEGVDQVLYAVADALETAPKFDMEEVEENTVVYNYEEEEAPFVVHNLGNGQWTITGKKIERLVSMTSLVSDDAIKRLSIKMRNMGIDEALRNAGCQDGDVVSILDFEFEFYD